MDRPKWPKYRDHLKAHRFWSILNALFCTLMYIYIFWSSLMEIYFILHLHHKHQHCWLNHLRSIRISSGPSPRKLKPRSKQSSWGDETPSMIFHDNVWHGLTFSQYLAVLEYCQHTHMHAHTPACMYDICICYFLCMHIWYIYISYHDVKINVNKLYIELLCYNKFYIL